MYFINPVCWFHIQVKCIEFSLAILYIVLVSAFFGWGLFHRTRERRRIPASNMKPLLNFEDEKLTTLKVDSDFFFSSKYSCYLK